MTNREALTVDEAEERGIVCSDGDVEDYKRITDKHVKSLDAMRKWAGNDLDEGKRDEKRDLSWTGTQIEEVGLHVIGPYTSGGQAIIYLSAQDPVNYVWSEDPRRDKSGLEKEFANVGYEEFSKRHDAGLAKRMRALKKIFEKTKGNKLSTKRFVREGDICRRLKSPKFSGAIYADSSDIVSRMFLDRISLIYLWGRTARERFEIGVDLGESMVNLNRLGVLHRDLTPNNVMALEPDNQRDAKLTDKERSEADIVDFGEAKVVGMGELSEGMSMEVITQAGFKAGTPAWMPPETIKYDKKVYDVRSEIYAFGATFYTLLTGNAPIDLTEEEKENTRRPNIDLACKVLEWYNGKISVERVPIHEANEEIPDCGLNELVVDRCMARYPQDRPDSFEQVYSELLEIRGNLPLRRIDTDTGRFQIPTHGQRTIIFSEAKEERDQEQELAKKKKRRKRDTRMARFEDQGIEIVEGGDKLHDTVQRVLGAQELEPDAINLDGNPFDLSSGFSERTIVIDHSEGFSPFLRKRSKVPVYIPRTWGAKSGSYRKFHKK